MRHAGVGDDADRQAEFSHRSGPARACAPGRSSSSARPRRRAAPPASHARPGCRCRAASGPTVSRDTCAWIGTPTPASAMRAADAGDGGLDLQDVLAGLDQQHVDAALDQAARLLAKTASSSSQVFDPRTGRTRGQIAGRPDRAGDEARPLRRGEPVGLGPREPGGRAVELDDSIRQAVLLELNRLALNVSVSRTSQPASRNDAWMPAITSGRVTTGSRCTPRALAAEIVGREVSAWMLVPIAPSKTSTRSASSSR